MTVVEPEGPRSRQTRRMAVAGSGPAMLAAIGSTGGALLSWLIGAPLPVLAASAVGGGPQGMPTRVNTLNNWHGGLPVWG